LSQLDLILYVFILALHLPIVTGEDCADRGFGWCCGSYPKLLLSQVIHP